ncbi:hypothetical protein SAMN05444678_1345 [Sphingomonas sp. YR710]|uniref:hypothetical protein n=1 Tax=Sphingomonas sp. YR710 TaxID=1882773 RepID=UPI00088ADA34|nr:hypothetical protein [Sphingomonas sp. YR710]SDD89873.1 hypothetical protein SAMN05444678_1345 [Sphingomonas sp. YR710]
MDWASAMPVSGLTGRLLIELTDAVMLLGLGRIAGVSGLAEHAFKISPTGAPWRIAAAFVIALPIGAWIISLISAPR